MTNAPEAVASFEYRTADIKDAAGIFAVLEESAPEIPVPLATDDSRARLKTTIVQCCPRGESWVATDAGGDIVGVALASSHRYTDGKIHLYYVAVLKSKRRRGIFDALMKKLMANGAPVTASVLKNNQSDMVARLVNLGFTNDGGDAKESKLKWEQSQT